MVSSWGPYTSIVGTATKTGVAGLTTKAELTTRDGSAKASEAWQLVGGKAHAGAWAATGEEIAQAFADIDADGNGVISKDELAVAIKKVAPSTSDEDVARMVALADEGTGASSEGVTLQAL